MSFITIQAPHVLVADIPVIGLHTENPTEIIKTCLRRGFTPVWASEIAEAVLGRKLLPAQPVCLTYDDGGPAWFSVIHPVLVSYNFKTTLFVTSDYLYQVDLAAFTDTGITWDQARTMHATGLYDWQNHGKTHASWGAGLLAELEACEEAIVSELAAPHPTVAAYPYGFVSPDAINTLKAEGYVLAFIYGAESSDLPAVFPTPDEYTVPRADSVTEPLLWAKQQLLHSSTWNRTGERNANNVLGYWTMPPEGSLNSAGAVVLNSTTSNAALSVISTDYFHVVGGYILARAYVASTGSLGTAKASIRQYDAARAALATIDIASVTGAQGSTLYDDRYYALDPACRFVRLEVSGDTLYNGTVTVDKWEVRVA